MKRMRERERGKKRSSPSKHTPLIYMIILFLAGFYVSLTFSNPAIFLNDEWISANQLHQLDLGHQIAVNEGKYGTWSNGTPGPYFEARGNRLQYTAMLPVLSFPALALFRLFGDHFRLFVTLLWSFIPLLIGILLTAHFPGYSRIAGHRWIWPLLALCTLLLLINLVSYTPFPFTKPDAPREVAAIVFTNHILFGLTCVLVYFTIMTIFSDNWIALFGVLVITSSSSYLFWAASAKDHMLVAFCFALVVFLFITYLSNRKWYHAAMGFFSLGLLTWARPEVGFFATVCCILFYLTYTIITRNEGREGGTGKNYLKIILPILFLLLGLVPFLINNIIVTGNPFTPTFFTARIKATSTADISPAIASQILIGISESVASPISATESILSLVSSYFSVRWAFLPPAVYGILLNPASGNMGFFAVCPLSVFALVIPLKYVSRKESLRREEIPLFIFLLIAGLSVFIAYLPSFHILSVDGGIVPDMRYLSPAYIPLGILGLSGIVKLYERFPGREMAIRQLLLILTLTPTFLILLLVLQPFGGFYLGYSLFFKYLILFVFVACMGLLLVESPRTMTYFSWALGILLAVPLAWQAMMLFLYSVAKFNGYPFWIPLVEHMYDNLIQVNYINN